MTLKEFAEGWKHFCDCIDFSHSRLDPKAIQFMIEMTSQVNEALLAFNTKKKYSERNSEK